MVRTTILIVIRLIIILTQIINCAYSHTFVGNQINYSANSVLSQTQIDARNEPDFPGSRTTEERITSFGYPVEMHDVITKDGYVLTMHRIPYGKKLATPKRKPVLFQHGGLADSYSWLFNFPENNLAIRLADEGYDIWLANARGTKYSRRHLKFSDQDRRFFDFSMHEIAKYDIPAQIDYILNVTGEEKLFFAGLSLGAPFLHMTLSILPEYNQKLSLIISMAPTAYLTKSVFPIGIWAGTLLGPVPKILLDLLIENGEFPSPRTAKFLKAMLHLAFAGCLFPVHYKLCQRRTYILFGRPLHPGTMKLIAGGIDHGFAPISTKFLNHVLQIITSGRFQQYDYGEMSNAQFYGSIKPPLYLLNSTTAPTAVYYGEHDINVVAEDVTRTVSELSNVVLFHKINSKSWSHLDFLISQDIKELFINDVVKLMEKY